MNKFLNKVKIMLCEGSLGVIAHLPRKTGDSLISPVCVSLSLRLSVFLPHYVSFLVSLSCSVCLSLCVSVLSPHFHLFFLSPSTMISLSVCLHLQLPDFLSLSLSGCLYLFPSLSPSPFLGLCLSALPFRISFCLSVSLCVTSSVFLCLSLFVSVYLFLFLHLCISIFLSSSIIFFLSLSVCVCPHLHLPIREKDILWQKVQHLSSVGPGCCVVCSKIFGRLSRRYPCR